MTSSNTYCQLLINIAQKHGVESIYCSPGSRNAPLLLAAAGAENIQKRVVIDERSAAFMAIGEATVSKRPVMLVCTSGTALLNYSPAVAEAYYAGIPIIVVSADRPSEWIDQDDSQTINQFGILEKVIKKSFDIPVFSPEDTKRGQALEWFVDRSYNDAFITALAPKAGPVHINIQLDNPLGSTLPGEGKEGRYINFVTGSGDLSIEKTKELAQIASSSRVLLLCGFMLPDDKMRKAVAMMTSEFPNVAVMAETLANVNSRWEHETSSSSSDITMVDSLLSTLSKDQLKELSPDLVITVGGALVSRQVKEWLRTNKPSMHWSVGYQHTTVDCLQALTSRIQVRPERFLRQLAIEMRKLQKRKNSHPAVKQLTTVEKNSSVEKTPNWRKIGDYRDEFAKLRVAAKEYREEFLRKAPWSDLKAFYLISQLFPKNANLFLSNGTSVRYDQLFGIPSHATYCNRGVSGIDGCTSTAIGGAIAYSGTIHDWDPTKRQTILITGDMSFSYDIGALGWSGLPGNFKIIVMNNSGGGIFRFIGSTSKLPEEILDRYFCCPPEMDIQKVAQAFGLATLSASNEEELEYVLPLFFAARTSTLLEIRTNGDLSAKILTSYLSPDKKTKK